MFDAHQITAKWQEFTRCRIREMIATTLNYRFLLCCCSQHINIQRRFCQCHENIDCRTDKRSFTFFMAVNRWHLNYQPDSHISCIEIFEWKYHKKFPIFPVYFKKTVSYIPCPGTKIRTLKQEYQPKRLSCSEVMIWCRNLLRSTLQRAPYDGLRSINTFSMKKFRNVRNVMVIG